MSKSVVGYTTGIFDLFHIGHLNIFRKAKSMCDILIVGVSTDELAVKLKKRKTVIPFNERIEIVSSIKYVDKAVPEYKDDKLGAWEKYKFDIIFKGDDWKGSRKWNELEVELNKLGVKIIYFSYTKHISSSKLIEKIS